jgi:ribosome-associated translation inhibitor RaiA
MWISIRTKRVSVSPRMRQRIEAFLRRTFDRERRYIGSVVIRIAPAKLGHDVGYDCRITLWSHYLGLLVANDSGGTIRTAVQQAVSTIRKAFRRQLHKRRSKTRRANRSRVSRWLSGAATE